jgi:hypothetical protein
MADDYARFSRREIGVNPFAKKDKQYEDIPASSGRRPGISDQFIVLDSFIKLRDSSLKPGEFKWNLAIQGHTKPDLIGVNDRLTDIIEVEFGSFYLPIPPDVDYLTEPAPANGETVVPPVDGQIKLYSIGGAVPVLQNNMYPSTLSAPPIIPWQHNPYSQLPYSGIFTVQIKEFGRQAYSDIGGNFHHFEYRTKKEVDFSANIDNLFAKPVKDIYKFKDPVRTLDTITVAIRNPDNLINFLPDVIYDVPAEKKIDPIYGNTIVFKSIKHGLKNGDRVFIAGAKCSNSSLNSYLNRVDGHVIDKVNDDEFRLDPIICANYLGSLVVDVLVAKRRIRIPIRIRCLAPHSTNFMSY